MTIRVRFAPSPTGFLHIGGARTALFNWLFARHLKGTFILRIEDTDEVRSTEESVNAIFKSMQWLELDWDEGPKNFSQTVTGSGATYTVASGKDPHPPSNYFQIQRCQRRIYQNVVDELLNKNLAYPCFCTSDEVQKMRDKALLLKRPPRYDGTCRKLTKLQCDQLIAEGRSPSIRFKTPEIGITEFHDIIRGPMKFDNALLEDFVVLKTPKPGAEIGVPTYNFACVVDDHFMEISHVIRGDDHLSNTPRQIRIYEALGWQPPVFAHLSMILGPDGSRLSKRHGATSVQEYEQAGYLPEAVRNYLALLGWSTADSQDLFGREELVEKFALERCGKSPAIFDPQKLVWMNGEHIRKMPSKDLADRAMPFIRRAGFLKGQEEARRAEIEAAVALEQEKIKLLTDVPTRIDLFFQDLIYDPESVEKVLKKPDAPSVLEDALRAFEPLEPFTAASTEEACKAVAVKRGVKNAAVFHPVRVAVSGRTQGPSLFAMLELLGKPRCLDRLRRTLKDFAAITK